MKKPKIIIWDLETQPIVATTWDLYPNFLSIDNIQKDWALICGAWKELGAKKTHAVKVKKVGDDYAVVKKLRDVLATADIIVHHNGDKFDLKKLNARIIYHKIDPLPKILTVDTLKEAKKIASFSSNKLDYLAKTLVGTKKIHVDYDLWLAVLRGSKKALKAMVEYNKVDVEVTEQVYERLLPYMKNPPHMGVLKGNSRNFSCKNCGSANVKLNGIRHTAAGLQKQEIQCKDCHGYSVHPIAPTAK